MRFPWRKPAERQLKSASLFVGAGAAKAMANNFETYALEGYSINPIIHACVDKIADAMSSVDIQLYTKKNGKRQLVDKAHPLKTLLCDKPNPAQSPGAFIAEFASFWLIGGNAYMYGVGADAASKKAPTELWVLNTGKVKPVENPNGQLPSAYEYRPSPNKVERYEVNQLTGHSAIMHLKTFNPLSKWVGLPPVMAAAFAADVFNEGQKWNLGLLQNSARPSGALTMKNADGSLATLSEEQFDRLKAQIDDQYSGSANSGRPLLLEGGMEWNEMSQTAKDMDHERNMLNNARWIAGVYGVPPMLINIPGESTFSNFEQARMALWTDSVLPKLNVLLGELNRWLCPLYGQDLELWYDEEMIPALEPLRKEKADRINNADYMTIDEKRKAMGLDDLPSGMGNVILVQSSEVPLDLVGSMNLPEPGSPAAQANAN